MYCIYYFINAKDFAKLNYIVHWANDKKKTIISFEFYLSSLIDKWCKKNKKKYVSLFLADSYFYFYVKLFESYPKEGQTQRKRQRKVPATWRNNLLFNSISVNIIFEMFFAG